MTGRAALLRHCTGILVAVALAGAAAGCEQRDPGPAAGAAPATATGSSAKPPERKPGPADGSAGLKEEAWAEGGVDFKARYVVYADLDKAMAAQPSGSIDAMVVDFPATGSDIVLVEVTVLSPVQSPPKRYGTKFSLDGGKTLQKSWSAADSNLSGPFRALVSVPRGVKGAETRQE
jgi:hypothetical protein